MMRISFPVETLFSTFRSNRQEILNCVKIKINVRYVHIHMLRVLQETFCKIEHNIIIKKCFLKELEMSF